MPVGTGESGSAVGEVCKYMRRYKGIGGKVKQAGCWLLIIVLLPYIITVFITGPKVITASKADETMVKIKKNGKMPVEEYCIGVLEMCIRDRYRREEMPMKTKFKVIIAVILAAVISIGSISAYKYITSPKEESIPLETTLEDAAELTTQKMIISDVFRSTKGTIPLINKNRFLVQYKTTITAGLDVQNAKIKETDRCV